jgi:uncharacterized membrane protein
MDSMFERAIEAAARMMEGIAALVLTWGAITTFLSIAAGVVRGQTSHSGQRAAWLRLARWLVMSLEFQLAADVLHTSVAPTWTEIGQVAALALIRTFLNWSLESDLEKATVEREGDPPTLSKTAAPPAA